ncbi:MAG: adenylate/guanylate cyclase domain-containing protein [Bacteroidota bacterium]
MESHFSPTTAYASADSLLLIAEPLVRNEPDSAFILATNAARLAGDHHEAGPLAKANWMLGSILLNQGDYQNATKLYQSSLKQYKSVQDSNGIANVFHGLALIDWRYGNYDSAMHHHQKALSLRTSLQDSAGMADSYYALGRLRAELTEYQEALRYYDLALAIVRRKGDRRKIADILNVVGRAWRKQEIYDKALEAHEESLALYEALEDDVGISDYYNNVGSIYRRKGNYEEALRFFFTALDIQTRLGDQEGLADGYNDIGTTFCQKGEYSRAINFLEKGLTIAQKTGLKDDVRYALASLYATYDSMGDYRKALYYYQLQAQMKDSLLNADKQKQLTQMRVNFQTSQQAQEIERLKTERELFFSQQKFQSERNRLIATIVGAILLLLMIFAGVMIWRSRLQTRLNRKLASKNRTIELERKNSEELLHNILPVTVADELKGSLNNKVKARSFEEVSVMFTDFKGFSKIVENMSPRELVDELHECFKGFDEIIAKHGLEKIKTIGDAYMCAGGLPEPNTTHAQDVIRAGLEIQTWMAELKTKRIEKGLPYFEARLGIHTGPVVAGVVGMTKFAYDIWGDTVNTAARMESSGEPGRVNISHDTYLRVRNHFICQHRGKVFAKDKGEIDMYFVEWAI